MDAFILVPILLGWLAGLFVNYTSDVLPTTRRFSWPACPHCQTPFSWADYLTLRACRSCGKGRNLRTWIVQFLAVASFVYFWLFPSERLGFTLGMIVLTYFGILTIIDLEHRLILHLTSAVGAVLGIFVGTFIYNKEFSLLESVGKSLLGGLIGFGIMFLLYQIGALVARYRARKMQAQGQGDDGEEALGGGDVFLLGVLGLMTGPAVMAILFYGVLLGGLVSLALIITLLIRRRYSSDALMTFIPYGPYFILAAFYTLFF
jgi:prepilin signal peptidase PulO-like enzyme (type II secretory pathway)